MAKKNSEVNPTRKVPQEAIAQCAYEIWEREGRPQGRAAEHWFRAVSELKSQTQVTEAAGRDKPPVRRTPARVPENRFQPTGQ
jgi:hypothetical protein